MLLLPIVLPILAGALLPAFKWKSGRARGAYIMVATVLTSLLTAWLLFTNPPTLHLISFAPRLSLSLHLDDMGRVFAGILALLWPITSWYALHYMKDDAKQNSFFAFFTMSFGATLGVALSANLLSLYVFYEFMSLMTLPLVLHGGSTKAIKAGLKYLYYSLGGAAFAFIGLVYLLYFGTTTEFVPGGLFAGIALERSAQLRLGYLFCFLGFSVKAAVFPVHGWLPTASIAPTPVTALLHAVAVVKSGVFAILRVTYFSFGALLIRDSFAQYIPLALSAITIVYGCSMALKEKHLKRRLAYSTVSNLSYIIFGALLLTPQGLTAGLMHLVFHALMKITLFLVAGVLNQRADIHYIQDMRGSASRIPLMASIFVICSLAMTGIPPLLGFLSKWALAQAAFLQGGWLPMLGVAALLISALLTAVYLLVPSVAMYATKQPGTPGGPKALQAGYTGTLVLLCAGVVALGFYSQPLIDFLTRAAAGAM